MNLEILCVCHSSKMENGKLNIGEIFDTMFVGGVPATVNRPFQVLLRVRLNRSEYQKHTVTFDVRDSSESQRIMTFETEKITEPAPSIPVHVVCDVPRFIFKKLEAHTVVASVDGREMGSVPILLLRTEPS